MTTGDLTSIIIVLADSGPLTRDCVEHALASDRPVEVIVVDNGSDDGIPEALDRAYAADDRVRVIYNRANLGFGPAVNRGAAQARGKFLLVLNPDCLIDPDTLSRMLAHVGPHTGIVGAVVQDAAGHVDPASRRRDPLLARALATKLGRGDTGIDIRGPLPATAVPAEVVSGAILLMPRAAFETLGGFDEIFFLHCEDMDLCRRARDMGYQVLLAGDVHVMHGKGGSSRHRPVFVSRHKHRSMFIWFRRHDPAAKNPLLRGLVWLGIWSHFLLKIPGQLVRKKRR
ncbi:glycosyltransferase family 2 protein [Luteibacter aegosomatissinici]|uniref:glycosyltransferase family 2 protein n=1 Tax=Luteibacter aegosomatissinici TaxID=2911539 RepID=UPI001FFC0A02|nr:glycosyltransferase family 2 protein [Luteibacter aegosomatissinici]UPG93680.1 glycosyltransferase family 2 protein [Luteibacter aegosomatissinici]